MWGSCWLGWVNVSMCVCAFLIEVVNNNALILIEDNMVHSIYGLWIQLGIICHLQARHKPPASITTQTVNWRQLRPASAAANVWRLINGSFGSNSFRMRPPKAGRSGSIHLANCSSRSADSRTAQWLAPLFSCCIAARCSFLMTWTRTLSESAINYTWDQLIHCSLEYIFSHKGVIRE